MRKSWHICIMMVMMMTIWLMADTMECYAKVEFDKINKQQRGEMLAKKIQAARIIEKTILGMATVGAASCAIFSGFYMQEGGVRTSIMGVGAMGTVAFGSWLAVECV